MRQRETGVVIDPRRPPRALLDELRALGCEPVLAQTGVGLAAGGSGLCLPVRSLATDPSASTAALTQVRDRLTRGQPLGLSLVDVGRRGERRLAALLRRLDRATAVDCIDRRLLTLAVAATSVPPWLLGARAWLGSGSRYLLFETAADQSATGAWSALHAQRLRARGIRPVFAAAAQSACPLLPDEPGCVPTTCLALMVPPDTAWLPLRCNLLRHADDKGRIDEPALRARLRSMLSAADRLFDAIRWPDSAVRRDAHDHRRIVVVLEGLGDLLVARGADPGAIDSLRSLDSLVGGLRNELLATSRSLATERGSLPALVRRNPGNALPDARERAAWRQRWETALADVAVRHRNLLAIPLAALLPSTGSAGTDWFDLLPLLGHADVVGFGGRGAGAAWNVAEYRAYYRRARAILERRNAAALIASGV